MGTWRLAEVFAVRGAEGKAFSGPFARPYKRACGRASGKRAGPGA